LAIVSLLSVCTQRILGSCEADEDACDAEVVPDGWRETVRSAPRAPGLLVLLVSLSFPSTEAAREGAAEGAAEPGMELGAGTSTGWYDEGQPESSGGPEGGAEAEMRDISECDSLSSESKERSGSMGGSVC